MDAQGSGRRHRLGCTLLVAAAGYGKTTALEEVLDLPGTAYLTGRDPVPLTGGDEITRVVLDDLDRLGAGAQLALVRSVQARQPRVQLWIGTRRPPGRALREALRGPVVEQGPAALALRPREVARVLNEEHGIADGDLAYQIHRLTCGWPALVHQAGEVLAQQGGQHGELLEALSARGTAAADWTLREVLAPLPPAAGRLLGLLAGLTPVTAELCTHLVARTAAERQRVLDAFGWLVRTGLLVPGSTAGSPERPGTVRLVPVLAAILAGGAVQGPATRAAAAAWYRSHRFPLAAARTFLAAGLPERCARLLEEHGDDLLAGGGAAEVAALAAAVPEGARSQRLRLVGGDAARMTGDATAALASFAPLLEQARRSGCAPAALAWRASRVHYLRADYPAALDILDLAPDPPPGDLDGVLLQVARSSALLMLGHTGEARTEAGRALLSARALGDDRGLAAAHLASGLSAAGSEQEEHLAQALQAAERAGDLIQQGRVLVNTAEALLRRARYPEALQAASRAVLVGEGGTAGMLVVALNNAGEALLRMGRYEDAALHFERLLGVCRRAGVRRVPAGLIGLAELDRLLGRREQSRARFEEAVQLSRSTAELQALVPALAGLARVLADHPDARARPDPGSPADPDAGRDADPDAAVELVAEAEELATPDLLPVALLARGWVALAGADPAAARLAAAGAVQAARRERSDQYLAEALELAACAAADPAQARAGLQEALAIWRRGGAVPAADRVLVRLVRLPGAGPDQRAQARQAHRRLVAAGVAGDGWRPAGAEGLAAPVQVRVLGGFDVEVGGRAVPLTAWRSRQARTLVKILAARRGRPITRSELSDLLWPDDEPQRTAHRLSVLLSAVRLVLDPARAWPADRYLRADLTGVCLDLTHVEVDVEQFLREAADAIQLARAGEPDRARELLAEVDAQYRGEAFDEDPYEDWATGLREEARTAWLQSLRRQAQLHRQGGDPERAVSCLVRLLAADAFDESAHRELVRLQVRLGRHGEARRAFDRWACAMRSIDAPAPDPQPLLQVRG